MNNNRFILRQHQAKALETMVIQSNCEGVSCCGCPFNERNSGFCQLMTKLVALNMGLLVDVDEIIQSVAMTLIRSTNVSN